MEEDYSATTIASPSKAASWNPALRDNSAEVTSNGPQPEDDDDFFDRYPGATPKKQQSQPPQPSGLGIEQSESPIRRQSISVQSLVDVRRSDATADELRRVPSHSVEVEGPWRREPNFEEEYEEEDEEAFTRDDDEAAIQRPQDDAEEQREALEEKMPDFDLANGGESLRDDAEEETRQAEHYEHQGEISLMEEAMEPGADASLLQDEQPLPMSDLSTEPTIPQATEDHALDLDGEASPSQPPSKSAVAHPQLDRSFTTNFSEQPVQSQPQSQAQSTPSDWPSVGDDRTFGELLDDQKVALPDDRQKAMLEDVAAHESAQISSNDQPEAERATFEQEAAQESSQIAALDDDEDELLPDDEADIPEEDLAAAWGAVVEDDELLEEISADSDLSNLFGDDVGDGGFLQDNPAPEPALAPAQPSRLQQQQSRSVNGSQYAPALQSRQPQTPADMFGGHGRSAGTPSTGLGDLYSSANMVQQPAQANLQPQRPGMTQSQSFVDKAKGGYQSPYDLPMEVVKPRRRPPPPAQTNNAVQPPPPPPGSSPAIGHQASPSVGSRGPPGAPPPRSSSMSGQQPNMSGSVGSLSPPQSSGSTAAPAKAMLKGASGFFEDLPMTAKPRVRPSGAYNPSIQGMPTPPPQPTSRESYMPGPQQMHAPAVQPPQSRQQMPQQQPPAMYGGLTRRVEQLPLLPAQPSAQPQASIQPPHAQDVRYSPGSQQLGAPPAPPAVASRFSPAPSQVPSTAAPSRYSPAPGSAPKSRQTSFHSNIGAGASVHPFAPRTSSPLTAMHPNTDKPLPVSPPRLNGGQASRYAPGSESASMQTRRDITPPVTFAPPHAADSSYAATPPQRPRTQSPDATMKSSKVAAVRPMSSSGGSMPRSQTSVQLPTSAPQYQPQRTALPHRRQFSRDLAFAAPQDVTSQDPLQRWKGCPVFGWGPSGTIVSTFPKHTPFYASGQGMPSVKCTPGHITMQDATTFMPLDERNAKYPGPLTAKRKGQKKELLVWLTGKLQDLERMTEGALLDFSIPADARKRAEEKLLLWRIVRIFVENDGILEGNANIEQDVRAVLLPNLAQMAQVADLQSPASASAMADPIDKQVLFQIRQALLEGQRERAVWLAEEKKLWGHAMLIASTMGPEVWKQIVQSFVRSNVKSVGSDARSTAALYQVFAGNADECVDELVPPSARAGFQMISKTDGSVAGDPLEGLDQWRETLGLITSNRSPNDGASLRALGKLLAGYGRAEAAATCFLFARQQVKTSGIDDAEGDWTLLGANPEEGIGNDLDTIVLTEIYEYAASLSAPANSIVYLPHLQAYKLLHAQQLAAYGHKTKAQTYVDAITSAYTSTTRPSPYYHPTFTQAVAEFGAFLAQAPHDGKGGKLFSRPAMNKVSSGAASWFTKFVAGEDDNDSNASGPGGPGSDAGAGPFGGVNGEFPIISRSESGSDLYQSMSPPIPIPGMQQPSLGQPFSPSSGSSRYAPGGPRSIPSTQPDSGLGIPSAEPQRPSSSRYAPAPSPGSLGVPGQILSRRASNQSLPYAPSRRGSAQDTTSSVGSYEPRPILADEASGYSYSPAIGSPLVQAQAHQEAETDTFAEEVGQKLDDFESGQVEGGGYMPPTSGYEPPSYQPYEPEPDSPVEKQKKPKKKAFNDDEEDDALAQRAAALKKAQADRAADDAFRKAAEADAARDKPSEQKKGWLGGWFGGKKDPNAAPGPIKAKLGEENSFYYDKELGKWVNKKGGAEAATPVAATPPPPKGAASRVASGMGPPSGPPSRASSGMGPPPGPPSTGRPPTSGSGPAFTSSGPNSRSGTPAFEMGGHIPPAGINGDGPPLSAALPLRPASSLSTASSIDDLLGGPPGPRKGGTVKGKKKGGRYVDVMAK